MGILISSRRATKVLAVALLALLTTSAGARVESGAAAEPDFPQFTVIATDQGLDVPGSVTAGRYRVVLQNEGSSDHGVYLFHPPDGATFEDLLFPESEPAEGSAEIDPLVQLFQTLHWVGGPGHAGAGNESTAIVDLTPGIYGLMDPTLGHAEQGDWLSLLIVNPGEGMTKEPEASQSIELREMSFDGLPATIAAGEQVWKVTNTGEQPHELYVAKAPDGTTVDQLREALSAGPGSPPQPDGLDLSHIISQGAMAPLAAGVTGWAELDLEPGTYVAFCLIPDWSGMTHGAMGMATVFTVE